MPRKYTRRAVAQIVDANMEARIAEGAELATDSDLAAVIQASRQAPSAPPLTAMEEYGLWLKQNQHVTNPLPPEPPKPRKPAHVPRPRY